MVEKFDCIRVEYAIAGRGFAATAEILSPPLVARARWKLENMFSNHLSILISGITAMTWSRKKRADRNR